MSFFLKAGIWPSPLATDPVMRALLRRRCHAGSVRSGGSTMSAMRVRPAPSAPWQRTHFASKTARPRSTCGAAFPFCAHAVEVPPEAAAAGARTTTNRVTNTFNIFVTELHPLN